jgi:hypothetical protein
MFFQKKIDRTLNWLKEKNNSDRRKSSDLDSNGVSKPGTSVGENPEKLELEKHDFAAIVIAALLVFAPILIILIIILLIVLM